MFEGLMVVARGRGSRSDAKCESLSVAACPLFDIASETDKALSLRWPNLQLIGIPSLGSGVGEEADIVCSGRFALSVRETPSPVAPQSWTRDIERSSSAPRAPALGSNLWRPEFWPGMANVHGLHPSESTSNSSKDTPDLLTKPILVALPETSSAGEHIVNPGPDLSSETSRFGSPQAVVPPPLSLSDSATERGSVSESPLLAQSQANMAATFEASRGQTGNRSLGITQRQALAPSRPWFQRWMVSSRRGYQNLDEPSFRPPS